jgi:predicted dehydrogenase
MLRKLTIMICSVLVLSLNTMAQDKVLNIGIAGLTHSHVHGLLGRENKGDIRIVGIAEPDRNLALRFSKQYGFSMSIVYNTLEEMIAATKPEAVAAFGSIFQHLGVVESCAPKGIHVMVEKPLAVSMDHARKMETLAKKFRIQLLTNYETTWYPTNSMAYQFLYSDTIGELRKVIVHDGHRGPTKVGVNSEFLEWLTDPIKDGGGAIVDFGCYGVNLMNWLMKGVKPASVTAVTQQLQPENNPNVDDESIIILKYAKANAIIQGSWNWPIGRKDMEIYGLKGAIYCDNKYNLRVRIGEGYDGFREQSYKFKDLDYPVNDPFAYFAAVIRGKITLKPYDLSSLENNMLVVEILDAARQSAKSNSTVRLKD